MQSQKYSAVTGQRKVEPYQSGRSSIRQLELMQNKGEIKLGTDPDREPFAAVDNLTHLAQELATGLKNLRIRNLTAVDVCN